MQLPVRRENLLHVNRKRPALEIRNSPARFFQNDPASSGIPRLKVQFPKPVQPARSDIAEVERRGASAPHRLACDKKLAELADNGLQPLSEVVREAGNEERL